MTRPERVDSILLARYHDEIHEATEQEKWEQDQSKVANQFNFGSETKEKVLVIRTSVDYVLRSL